MPKGKKQATDAKQVIDDTDELADEILERYAAALSKPLDIRGMDPVNEAMMDIQAVMDWEYRKDIQREHEDHIIHNLEVKEDADEDEKKNRDMDEDINIEQSEADYRRKHRRQLTKDEWALVEKEALAGWITAAGFATVFILAMMRVI